MNMESMWRKPFITPNVPQIDLRFFLVYMVELLTTWEADKTRESIWMLPNAFGFRGLFILNTGIEESL